MAVRHPYHFVPFRRNVPRETPQRPAGRSGSFECVLETLTPLCLKKHFEVLHRDGHAPYLTGSSLKGMVRSFLQMFGAGCGMNYDFEAKDKLPIPPTKLEERGLGLCTIEAACSVCRMFGFVNGDKSWGAKVRIRNSCPPPDWTNNQWLAMDNGGEKGLPRMMSYGPYRRSFYYPEGEAAGWKFYLHAKKQSRVHQDFASGDCVPAGIRFCFRVDYEGLTEEEFALLRFGLCLAVSNKVSGKRVALHHKVGYGKPLGYGSCEITISRETERSGFFQSDRPAAAPAFDLQPYFDLPGFGAIRKYCSWDEASDELQYPGGNWLLKNKDGTIPEFEAYLRQAAKAASPEDESAIVPVEPEPTLPDVLRVRVTSIKKNLVRIETMEEFGQPPKKYWTSFPVSPYFRKRVGDEYEQNVKELEKPLETLK